MFVYLKYKEPALVAIICFQFFYQLTLGSFYFVYVSQVGGEAINSVAIAALWCSTLLVNTMMAPLTKAVHPVGTFAIFSIMSLVGAIFSIVFMRSIAGLSKEEIRQLYYPDALKSKFFMM